MAAALDIVKFEHQPEETGKLSEYNNFKLGEFHLATPYKRL